MKTGLKTMQNRF